ncbi:hypothetical protein IPH67_03530 [bacterium]|nr:MAG: hypothetical protein IPH67_03530 [bacterium]
MLIFLLLYLCQTGVAVAGFNVNSFGEAVSLYDDKQYQAALGLFEKIEPKTPAVFLNMALCHFYIGNKAKSYALFRFIMRHGGRTLAVRANQFLKTFLLENAQQAQPHPLCWSNNRMHQMLFSVIESAQWIPVIFWQCIIIFCLFCFLFFVTNYARVTIFYKRLCSFLSLLLLLFFSYAFYVKQACYGVTLQATEVRVGPSDAFEVRMVVPASVECVIKGYKKGGHI